MINVLDALNYLHSKSIIHRDLKLENLLLVNPDNDFMIKICDFGLACFSEDADAERCGSPGYVAPEILHKKPYSCEVDMFSIGIVLFTLLAGEAPFNGSSVSEILVKNKNCRIEFKEKSWKNVSENAIDLVKGMTEQDPAKRISAEEALRHPWLYEAGKLISTNTSSPITSGIGLSTNENCISFGIIRNNKLDKDRREARQCENLKDLQKNADMPIKRLEITK
jgi:serine/threonine protein kinase